MPLQFNIITPNQIFLKDQANEIVLSTNTGKMGVLSGHAPLITALDVGVFLYRSTNTWTSIALMGGFALILQDNITILVNEAESADTIYLQEALECLEFARQQFFQAKNSKEKVSANFILKRAQARLKVVT